MSNSQANVLKDIIRNKIKGVKVGSSIKIIDRGHIKINDKYYDRYQENTFVAQRYENKNEVKADYNAINKNLSSYKFINNVEYAEGVLKVVLKNNDKVLEYKAGSEKVDFNKPITNNGAIIGFKFLKASSESIDYNATQANIKKLIKDVEENKETNKYKYIDKIEFNKDNAAKFDVVLKDGYTFSPINEKLDTEGPIDQNEDKKIRTYQFERRRVPNLTKPVLKDNKILGFENYTNTITPGDKGTLIDGEVIKKITIVSDDKNAETPNLDDLLPKPEEPPTNPVPPYIPSTKPEEKPSVNVETYAGKDRYETAINIAKETASYKDIVHNGNIVLVNGNALVDGLAASPLAAYLGKTSSVDVAPILLTKANSLPN